MVQCKFFQIWLLFLCTTVWLIRISSGHKILLFQRGLESKSNFTKGSGDLDRQGSFVYETIFPRDQKEEINDLDKEKSNLTVEKLFNSSAVLSRMLFKTNGSRNSPVHANNIKIWQKRFNSKIPQDPRYNFPQRRKSIDAPKRVFPRDSLRSSQRRTLRATENPHASSKVTGAGPNKYISNWPVTSNQILALKTKIGHSRKVLEQTEESLLEIIEEGDALRKQASRVTNIQRLNQFGKFSNRKKVDNLKNTYKSLDDAIKSLSETVKKEEEKLGGNSVDGKVQALEHKLRKQANFVEPNVDEALKSGWSTMTDSLADTTNFQWSALQENRGPPAVPIYRFGDGPGETTYLDEELKNMQQSIDSLSGESVDSPDPDLEKVDEVLHDFLTHESDRVTSVEVAKIANSVDDIETNFKTGGGKTDIETDVENMANAVSENTFDVEDRTSAMNDGVFYLQGKSTKHVSTASGTDEMEDSKEISETGSVTDNSVGADTNKASLKVQADANDGNDGENENDFEDSDDIEDGKETSEAESLTDNGVGADTNEASHEVQPNAGDDDNGSDETTKEDADDNGGDSKASEMTDESSDDKRERDEDAANRMITNDSDNVDGNEQGVHREARSVHTDPKVPVQKDTVLNENEDDSKLGANERAGVNTVVEKRPLDSDSAPPPLKQTISKENRAEYEEDKTDDQNGQRKGEVKAGGVDRDIDNGDTDNDEDEHHDEILFKNNNEAYAGDTAENDNSEDEVDTVFQSNDDGEFDRIDDVDVNKDKNLIETIAKTLSLSSLRAASADDDGNIDAGDGDLANDTPPASGEVVDEDDSPLYRPDPEFPVTGASSGDGVGSLAYWQNELDGLEEAERRNAKLVEELQRDMFGFSYGNHYRSGDMLFIEASSDADLAEKNPANGGGKSTRVSDLLSEQVQKIIQETKENKGKKIKSGRKILQPWRQNLDFDVNPLAGEESSRFSEKDLESLVNPDLGDMIRNAENNYRRGGYWRRSDKALDTLDLVDDLPINPKEFDYLHQLSDVSLLTKPVEVKQVKLQMHQPGDPRTKAALRRLDHAADTLKQAKEDIKKRRREHLKKELAELENLRRKVKIQREIERMKKMYQDIKEIPKLDAKTTDLRQKRVKQYGDMHKALTDAYDMRKERRKDDYVLYRKLLKQLRKNKKVLDKAMYEPPPRFPVHTFPKPIYPKRLMKRPKRK